MTSRKGKTRVKGHTLLFEGRAFNDEGYMGYVRAGGWGRAECSCGWLSDVRPNQAQRKLAHLTHKMRVIAGVPS